MRYARNHLYFIRVNTCSFNLIFCILWPWTRCLSSIVTLQLWTSCWLPEVLNVQNVFVLQYDYTLFFLSLRVQFHNCQYHCSFFPFITERMFTDFHCWMLFTLCCHGYWDDKQINIGWIKTDAIAICPIVFQLMLTWQYDCTFFYLQICCSSISCFTHYENCATPSKQAQNDAAM